MATTDVKLGQLLTKYESDILKDWINEQLAATTLRRDLLSDAELAEQSRSLLTLFREAAARDTADVKSAAWTGVRELVASLSRSRVKQGFTLTETATFVFSLKQPVFSRLRRELAKDPEALGDAIWQTTVILDQLGLYTAEAYVKGREEVITRQQQEMLELSTPVVELWDGVLALPLIGTLDSARTQIVMESLLQRIVETGAGIAIIDITGVPMVDTLVAQHLLKTVAAARLMGADCIISGIRPPIAQTIVHLGVDLTTVITKATLADAFAIALDRIGAKIARRTDHA